MKMDSINQDSGRGVKGLHCALNSRLSRKVVAIYLAIYLDLVQRLSSLIRVDDPVVPNNRTLNGGHPIEPIKRKAEARLKEFRLTTPRRRPENMGSMAWDWVQCKMTNSQSIISSPSLPIKKSQPDMAIMPTKPLITHNNMSGLKHFLRPRENEHFNNERSLDGISAFCRSFLKRTFAHIPPVTLPGGGCE